MFWLDLRKIVMIRATRGSLRSEGKQNERKSRIKCDGKGRGPGRWSGVPSLEP